MKKTISILGLFLVTMLTYAGNSRSETTTRTAQNQVEGEVIVMNKEMFIEQVFDYHNSKEWKYKGNKPAIIDLYADWCGPCRRIAPIMKELAKEYAGKNHYLQS